MGLDGGEPREVFQAFSCPRVGLYLVTLRMNTILTVGSKGRREPSPCPEQDSTMMELTGESPGLGHSRTKAKLETAEYSSRRQKDGEKYCLLKKSPRRSL